MLFALTFFALCGSIFAASPSDADLATARTNGLNKHNVYRQNHNSPDLALNSTLNDAAQTYANYLADNSLFQHSPEANSGKYGENLYYSCAYPNSPSILTSVEVASKAWYDEISLYNYAAPGFTSGTGHFTALVWKASTKVGFGVATGTKVSGSYTFKCVYVVANYLTPGNVNTPTYFKNNVDTPKQAM